jgi:hypothetical protein
VADDLWSVLMRYHREIAVPENERLFGDPLRAEMGAFRNEVNTRFDHVYQQLQSMQSERSSATLRRIS